MEMEQGRLDQERWNRIDGREEMEEIDQEIWNRGDGVGEMEQER